MLRVGDDRVQSGRGGGDDDERSGRIDIDQVGSDGKPSEPGVEKRTSSRLSKKDDQRSHPIQYPSHVSTRNLLSRHPPVAETADLSAPEPTSPLPRLFPVGRQLRDDHRRQTHHLPLLVDGLLEREGLVQLGDELEVVDPEGGLDGWMKREPGSRAMLKRTEVVSGRWRRGRGGYRC
jgi:hypothetical protein